MSGANGPRLADLQVWRRERNDLTRLGPRGLSVPIISGRPALRETFTTGGQMIIPGTSERFYR